MSSLTDRTIDPRDPLAYAPKWARDPVERQNTVRERSVCEPAAESISAEVSSADIAVTERRPPPPSFDPLPVPPRRSSSRFPMGIAGVTIAVVAIAVLLMLGKLPPWPVVAKDDGPEMGWFDSRFVGQRDRENFPSAAQFPGVKIAARPVNEEALLGEGLRRHQVASIVTKPAPRTRSTPRKSRSLLSAAKTYCPPATSPRPGPSSCARPRRRPQGGASACRNFRPNCAAKDRRLRYRRCRHLVGAELVREGKGIRPEGNVTNKYNKEWIKIKSAEAWN